MVNYYLQIINKNIVLIALASFILGSFSSAEDIKSVWKTSRAKTVKGEFEESWKEYEDLLIKNPKNFEVVFGAGCLKYYQAEKSVGSQQLDDAKNLVKEAEHYFDTAIQLAKNSEKKADGLYNKGNCNLLIANAQKENPQSIEECINYYRNAIRSYREAIENKSNFPEAKKNLEHALFQLKQLIQKKDKKKDENKQDSQSDKEQQLKTMFVETKTDYPDAEVRILEEQPNVVELKKKSN